MSDIRFNIFDFKTRVKWNGSIILYFIETIAFLSQFILFTSLAGQLIKWLSRKTPVFPEWITEGWLFSTFVAEIILLTFWKEFSSSWFPFWFAIYLLADSIAATLRDIILSPNIHSGHIQIRNRQRWIMLTFITILQVILSFAILIRCYGNQFNLPVTDSLTAVYISSVTFLTLGYGDYYPVDPASKILILSELGSFLIFLSLKLPVAVNMMRIIDVRDPNKVN